MWDGVSGEKMHVARSTLYERDHSTIAELRLTSLHL
jgi:hypothetical protein